LFLLHSEDVGGRIIPVDVEVFVQVVYEEVEELFGILLAVETPFSV